MNDDDSPLDLSEQEAKELMGLITIAFYLYFGGFRLFFRLRDFPGLRFGLEGSMVPP